MRFFASELQTALVQWRAMVNVEERSAADNFWFEQRVSPARQRAFEQEANRAADAAGLRKSHTDYYKTFVQVDEEIPHTFVATLSPADLGKIDGMQKIVRIESLIRPLQTHGISFDELKSAYDSNEMSVVDGFLRVWNKSNLRDGAPPSPYSRMR